ncbi:MAG: tRNA (N6-threonylcarbamoyladenosine(37)-N6)-methyltransferase TrmO, partial [Candidatus Bathyarchaeota archaeon]|nr:tRNA (N6-threonylcarbamoyladenosine(37)-N6)-methyltransferase TrmO [Candidatus Bathyarchaeota archaeon]
NKFFKKVLFKGNTKMMIDEEIKIKPIGFVKTKATREEVKDRKNISKIILNDKVLEGLKGIDDYSHLFIIFWMDQISEEKRKFLKIHPRGIKKIPLQGIFATRTSHRPNPIGLTIVELLKVKGKELTVRGLDAYDKTPVLDIKPYDFWDIVDNINVPIWWIELEKMSNRVKKYNDMMQDEFKEL